MDAWREGVPALKAQNAQSYWESSFQQVERTQQGLMSTPWKVKRKEGKKRKGRRRREKRWEGGKEGEIRETEREREKQGATERERKKTKGLGRREGRKGDPTNDLIS